MSAGRRGRLALPRNVAVRADEDGTPTHVGRAAVVHLRESWLVEDRWWTPQPLRRRYWEVVDERGRNSVVFHDLLTGTWHCHA